ncbi:MAG TPA: hypothetical protein VL181_05165 [Holophagaceae bacterium]|jgi:hypothetical protein|nr:hypothetical protein [Holophagaceae bacterium]
MAKIQFRSKLYFSMGVCIALGAGIGLALGNLPVGVGLGAVLGIVLSAAPKR